MRITENQIRRIIRQVLTEAKRATNWDEYVEYTVTNNPDLNLTEADMSEFVNNYKQVLAEYKVYCYYHLHIKFLPQGQ